MMSGGGGAEAVGTYHSIFGKDRACRVHAGAGVEAQPAQGLGGVAENYLCSLPHEDYVRYQSGLGGIATLIPLSIVRERNEREREEGKPSRRGRTSSHERRSKRMHGEN